MSLEVVSLMLQVEAVDIDEGRNGRVEYRLASGDDQHQFVVDSQLGTLLVAAPLDREQVNIYSFCIRTCIFSVGHFLLFMLQLNLIKT